MEASKKIEECLLSRSQIYAASASSSVVIKPPRKIGSGRKKIYTTEEDKKKAIHENNLRYREKHKNCPIHIKSLTYNQYTNIYKESETCIICHKEVFNTFIYWNTLDNKDINPQINGYLFNTFEEKLLYFLKTLPDYNIKMLIVYNNFSQSLKDKPQQIQQYQEILNLNIINK